MTTHLNFAATLFERNAHRSQAIAYVDDHTALSYGDLTLKARQFAHALKQADVRPEERVLLLMHDCNDWPIAFLGALYAGVVPVCLNTLLTPADYTYMMDHCRATAAVVSQALLDTFKQGCANAHHVPKHLWVSQASDDNAHRGFAFSAQAPALNTPYDTRADDVALWLYSSGSTGKPKGAVHSHANMLATAQLYGENVLALRETDVCFSAAKLYFAYGLGNALTFPLWAGACTVLMSQRPTPQAVFAQWTRKQHTPTVFFGAPTGYAGMLASPDAPSKSDVKLRLCSSAGEALPKELGLRFKAKYGCDIVDGIGSTEMLHIFLSNTPSDVRYGTSGKPVPGYEISLRNEQGQAVGVDEIGDLYIKGPSAALMYWADQAKSRGTFMGEWTKSGDKYTYDADGYYTYSGRSDDMLKVSGQYVSPFEVEGALAQHPSVLEAAVVGMPDENQLTRVIAYVVLKPNVQASDALIEELKQFVKQSLAPFKYPRVLHLVNELPKTATGKIQRFKLRELNV